VNVAAYEVASRQLGEVLHHYDSLDVELDRLVRGWQKLTPDIRRVVGNLAPDVVDVVLSIEERRRA
jgi:hypothetical protein